MSKKQVYEEKFAARLKEFNARIEVLKAKAMQAESSVKMDYFETIEDLEQKRTKALEQLAALKAAGDNAWEDLKGGVENAWSNLEEAVKAATSHFK